MLGRFRPEGGVFIPPKGGVFLDSIKVLLHISGCYGVLWKKICKKNNRRQTYVIECMKMHVINKQQKTLSNSLDAHKKFHVKVHVPIYLYIIEVQCEYFL